MSTSPKANQPEDNEESEDMLVTLVTISKGDLTTLHDHETDKRDHGEAPLDSSAKTALANVINDDMYQIEISDDPTTIDMDDDNGESDPLKTKPSEADEFDDEYHLNHHDTLQWFRKGTDRSETAGSVTPATSANELPKYGPTTEEQWEEFILHIRHAASYRAEFDIYQVVAYRAMVSYGQKVYIKPLKALTGMISDEWSNFEVRWLNSFQRVLCQAIICFCIQTLGVTAILITQFAAYFADQSENAQCDSGAARWKTEWHLKILAFLWTAFIALGVSGWVYKARHSGFYPVLLFLKRDQYPSFVSTNILQIGLLTNYYVVASSVIGSFILIYQTEGGTETIGMILQAVALFFILELDNRIVHSRDFLSIYKYLDIYVKNNKHKKIPHSVVKEEELKCYDRPLKQCRGNTCLSGTLAIASFVLLVVMMIGGFFAPWIIMICW